MADKGKATESKKNSSLFRAVDLSNMPGTNILSPEGGRDEVGGDELSEEEPLPNVGGRKSVANARAKRQSIGSDKSEIDSESNTCVFHAFLTMSEDLYFAIKRRSFREKKSMTAIVLDVLQREFKTI